MKTVVTIYSRTGCHLCKVAEEILKHLRHELEFELDIKLVETNPELEKLYGMQVPVIHIDGEHHDLYQVDPVRFRASLEKHRLHQ